MSVKNFGERYGYHDPLVIPSPAEGDVRPIGFEAQTRSIGDITAVGGEAVRVAAAADTVDYDGAETAMIVVHGKEVRWHLGKARPTL